MNARNSEYLNAVIYGLQFSATYPNTFNRFGWITEGLLYETTGSDSLSLQLHSG